MEIAFSSSCPDSAAMCKHVAATLYGIGARLDVEPELLFGLRKVDAKELIARRGGRDTGSKAARRWSDSGLVETGRRVRDRIRRYGREAIS
jgi:uncharacterized Zn finger protein